MLEALVNLLGAFLIWFGGAVVLGSFTVTTEQNFSVQAGWFLFLVGLAWWFHKDPPTTSRRRTRPRKRERAQRDDHWAD